MAKQQKNTEQAVDTDGYDIDTVGRAVTNHTLPYVNNALSVLREGFATVADAIKKQEATDADKEHLQELAVALDDLDETLKNTVGNLNVLNQSTHAIMWTGEPDSKKTRAGTIASQVEYMMQMLRAIGAVQNMIEARLEQAPKSFEQFPFVKNLRAEIRAVDVLCAKASEYLPRSPKYRTSTDGNGMIPPDHIVRYLLTQHRERPNRAYATDPLSPEQEMRMKDIMLFSKLAQQAAKKDAPEGEQAGTLLLSEHWDGCMSNVCEYLHESSQNMQAVLHAGVDEREAGC